MRMRTDPRVLVVGAGYAGVTAANWLAAHHHRVLLLNDRAHFVDRIRLHEYVAGVREAPIRPLTTMIRNGIDVLIGRAKRINPGSVELADGSVLAADHILVTVGSTGRSRGDGTGVSTLEPAAQAREQLMSAPEGSRVVIRGAGLTGVETVTEVATARPDLSLTLADPQGIGTWLPPSARRHLFAVLQQMGITILDGAAGDGRTGKAAITIDCTGFTAPPLAADSGLPVTADGWLRVGSTLEVPGHSGLWGAGDAVRVQGWRSQRMSCAAAEPMAAHAAAGIHARIGGRAPEPFDFGFVAQCVSLGRRDGIIAYVDPHDRMTGRVWTGRPAAWSKEVICRGAAWMPHRGATLYRWRGGGTHVESVAATGPRVDQEAQPDHVTAPQAPTT